MAGSVHPDAYREAGLPGGRSPLSAPAPARLPLQTFQEGEPVFDLDAEVADRVVDLRLTEQALDLSRMACLASEKSGLGLP